MGELKRCGSGLPAGARTVQGPHRPVLIVHFPHCPVLTVRIDGPTALTSEQEAALHEAILLDSLESEAGAGAVGVSGSETSAVQVS